LHRWASLIGDTELENERQQAGVAVGLHCNNEVWVALGMSAGQPFRSGDGIERQQGLREQRVTGRRKPETVRCPLNQGDAESSFKGRNRAGHRRLANAKFPGTR